MVHSASLVGGVLLDDGVLDEFRAFAVFEELHGEVATALGDGTEVSDVTEHLGEWDFAHDFLGITTLGLTGHLSATAGDITDDVTVVLFRDGDLNLHDWLKDDWIALWTSGLEGHGGSDFVSGFGRVDIMVGTIE